MLSFVVRALSVKRTQITIQERTISQGKKWISLKDAKTKTILLGVQVYEDDKQRIRFTRFHFPKNEIERLKNRVETFPCEPQR